MMLTPVNSRTLAAAIVLLAVAPVSARKWTSSDGKHRIEAELVDITGGVASLKRPDGGVSRVPVAKLSQADQKYLASLTKSNAKSASDPDHEKDLRKALLEKGIRVISTGVSLQDETRLSKGLREIVTVRKAMLVADQGLAVAQNRIAANNLAVINLTQLNVQLNARLANIRPTQVSLNNKLVGAINANNGQIQLFRQNGEQLERQLKAMRGKRNEARDQYIQSILDLRKVADSIAAQFSQLATDAAVKATVAELSKATGKPFSLEASPGFQASLRRLKSLEDTVLSETIPLDVDRGGTLNVSVVIDGKHTQEMVLDSGASLISLPQSVAAQCGVTVKPTDPTIVLELANGSRIPGKLVTIPSVRVGKFTVENVECAVLGPEAASAPPLLGMSFLGHFKFEVHAQEGKLTMVRVEPRDAKGAER